ncbi:MAG: aminopeptidase P family N-terminal domain-containing protein, partial [Cyanobacteria bacterium]|nr:aminopeptidase P family N-terminal domain-containing protein [Cyanobacteriota bacterium]
MVTTKSSKKNSSTQTPTLQKWKGAYPSTHPSSSSLDITTREKITQLRELMKKHDLSAYWIPSSDEHLNEYLPSERQRREWMSGFTGSMGDMLVTLEEAYLFVDSRYYQQADLEVDLNQITVIKLLMPNQPSMVEVFRKVAEKKGAEKKGEALQLGFDPNTVTLEIYRGLTQALSPKRLKNATLQWCPVSENLVDTLWNASRTTQATLPPITHLPDSISGLGTASKIQLIQSWMQKHHIDLLPIIKLDQIAWFLNLRGQDIPYNPLFMAYALVTAKKVYLFTAEARIPDSVKKSLGKSVEILPYDDFFNKLQTLIQKFPTPPCKVLIDPKLMPYGTLLTAEKAGAEIIELDHPTQLMKALKNPVELEGMRLANLKASLAKTRAFLWLQLELKKPSDPKTGKPSKKGKKSTNLSSSASSVTEETFRQAIEKFYAQDPAFNGLSFNTISGSGPNSSIVHYGTPDPEKSLLEGELFLIDSGVQYQ